MHNSADQTPPQERELTVREIFKRILDGQVVKIPNDPVAAEQLKNHLNVIKSREKKLFLDLGLDFISSIISVTEVKSPPQYLYDPSKINPDQITEAITADQFVKLGHLAAIEIPKTAQIVGYEVKLVAPKKRRTYTAFVIKNEPSPA